MFKLFIRGGIAHGRTSLCATCASAHIVTGYRDSEMVVICTHANPNIPILFEVKECTEYSDRDHQPPPAPVKRKVGFFVDQPPCGEEEPAMAVIDNE